MYLRELVVVLMRRWYLVVAALLCTVAVAYQTLQMVPPTYTAQAQVLLLPPQASVPKGENPYLYLGGLTPAGDVLSKALLAPETVEKIRTRGGKGTYIVELDVNSPAPIVSVTVEGRTEEDTLETLRLVIRELAPALEQVQSDAQVPAGASITSALLTSHTSAERVIKGQLRALIAVAGATLVGLALLIAAIDALLMRPRRRANPMAAGDGNLKVSRVLAIQEESETFNIQERDEVSTAPLASRSVKGRHPPRSRDSVKVAPQNSGPPSNGRVREGRPETPARQSG